MGSPFASRPQVEGALRHETLDTSPVLKFKTVPTPIFFQSLTASIGKRHQRARILRTSRARTAFSKYTTTAGQAQNGCEYSEGNRRGGDSPNKLHSGMAFEDVVEIMTRHDYSCQEAESDFKRHLIEKGAMIQPTTKLSMCPPVTFKPTVVSPIVQMHK